VRGSLKAAQWPTSSWFLPAAAAYFPIFVVRFRALRAKMNNDRKKKYRTAAGYAGIRYPTA
jgi:hypothetical protein